MVAWNASTNDLFRKWITKIMTDEQTTGAATPLNEIFSVLSHEYHRRILWALAGHESRGGENFIVNRRPGEDSEPDVLRLQLVHSHLPKLDDQGFVNWAPETETLARGSRFGEIEPFLRLMNEHREELSEGWP